MSVISCCLLFNLPCFSYDVNRSPGAVRERPHNERSGQGKRALEWQREVLSYRVLGVQDECEGVEKVKKGGEFSASHWCNKQCQCCISNMSINVLLLEELLQKMKFINKIYLKLQHDEHSVDSLIILMKVLDGSAI